jgi:hypothetical protein
MIVAWDSLRGRVDSQAGSCGFKVENLDVDSLSEARNGVIEDRVRCAGYSLGSRGTRD